MTPELAQSFHIQQPTGVLVAEVIEGSPAAKGGIQRGDIITSFDASIIHDMHELPRVVANTPVGKKVKIDILRQGKSTLTVTIVPLKEETLVSEIDVARQLGMEVTDLTANSRKIWAYAIGRGSWSPLWWRRVWPLPLAFAKAM